MLTKSIASVKNQLRQLTPYAKNAFSGGKSCISRVIIQYIATPAHQRVAYA